MKEFMMIFLGADYQTIGLSPEESQQRMKMWMDWIGELTAQDKYVEGRPLIPSATRMSGKSALVTDGPFVETKELIGGYFIVKANSLDEVKEMAKGFPDFDLDGTVEIREVMQM